MHRTHTNEGRLLISRCEQSDRDGACAVSSPPTLPLSLTVSSSAVFALVETAGSSSASEVRSRVSRFRLRAEPKSDVTTLFCTVTAAVSLLEELLASDSRLNNETCFVDGAAVVVAGAKEPLAVVIDLTTAAASPLDFRSGLWTTSDTIRDDEVASLLGAVVESIEPAGVGAAGSGLVSGLLLPAFATV